MSSENGKRRVTFVLPRNFDGPIGGYKVVYEYSNRLSRRGWHVTLAHICEFEKRSFWGTLTRNGGHRVRSSRPTWFELDSSIDSVQWSHWYPKVARNADVVVATAWMTAEFLGHDPRGLYFIQGYEVWDGPKDRVDATWRLPLRKLVIAQWLKDKAEELGAGPVTVVPNAIDSDIFNLDAPPEERSPDEIAMLWHYAPYKGSKDGLEALRMVRESRPNLHVTLFSGMAEPSGMPDWVTFVHNANQSQLRLIYNRAALFVSPSHTEGWGLPAAEAMACGAAVVSTDNEGVRDYAINGVTALVTPIRNPEALAGAILELLNDDGRRCAIARAGHEMMTTDFNWVSSTDLFEEALIDQVSAIGKGT